MPAALRVFVEGESKLTSLKEVQSLDVLTSVMPRARVHRGPLGDPSPVVETVPAWDNLRWTFTRTDLNAISGRHRTAIFTGRKAQLVRWLTSGHIAIDWDLTLTPLLLGRSLEVARLPEPDVIGYSVHRTTDDIYAHAFLNEPNPFVQWLLRLRGAVQEGQVPLTRRQLNTLLDFITTCVRYAGHRLEELTRYVDGLSRIPALQAGLLPPNFEITPQMFQPQPFSDNANVDGASLR